MPSIIMTSTCDQPVLYYGVFCPKNMGIDPNFVCCLSQAWLLQHGHLFNILTPILDSS